MPRLTKQPDVRARLGLDASIWAQMLLPAYRGMIPHVHATTAAIEQAQPGDRLHQRLTMQSATDAILHELRSTLRQLGGADCASPAHRKQVVRSFMAQTTARQQTSLLPLALDVAARLAMRNLLIVHGESVVFGATNPTSKFKAVRPTLAYLLNDRRFDDGALYRMAADLMVAVVTSVGNPACTIMHLGWMIQLTEAGRCGDFDALGPADWLDVDSLRVRLAGRMTTEQAIQRALLLVRLACALRCAGRPVVQVENAGAQTTDCSVVVDMMRGWWNRVRSEPVVAGRMTNAPVRLMTLAELSAQAPPPTIAEMEEGELRAAKIDVVRPMMRTPRPRGMVPRLAPRTSGRAKRVPGP